MGKGKLGFGDEPSESTRRDVIKLFAATSVSNILGETNVEATLNYVTLRDLRGNALECAIKKYADSSMARVELIKKSNGQPINVTLSSLDEESRQIVINALGESETSIDSIESETGFPTEITMVPRGEETGRKVTVEDVFPVHHGVPVEAVKIAGAWYAIDGIPKRSSVKSYPVAQQTIDELSRARRSPAGRPQAYGFTLEFESLDTSQLDDAPDCIATECTEFGAFFITAERGLVTTGEQPKMPDGESFKDVHWITTYGRDTLLIYTDGGNLYKIVGKNMYAELVTAAPIVRRDQVAPVGARVRSTKVRSENMTIGSNPGFYVDLGLPLVGDNGEIIPNWNENPKLVPPHGGFDAEMYQDLSDIPVTVNHDAVDLDQKNVCMIGSNPMGGFSVTYMENGKTRTTTYGVELNDKYEGNEMVSLECKYIITNTAEEFATKAQSHGFDHENIHHVVNTGATSSYFIDHHTGGLQVTRIYRGKGGYPGALTDSRSNFGVPFGKGQGMYRGEEPYSIRLGRGFATAKNRGKMNHASVTVDTSLLSTIMPKEKAKALFKSYAQHQYIDKDQALDWGLVGSQDSDFGSLTPKRAHIRGLIMPKETTD